MAQTLLGRNITFPIYNEDGTPFHNLVLHKVVVDSVVMSLGDNITGDIYYKDDSLEFTMKEYIEFKYNPDDEAEVPIKYVLVNPPTIVREGLVADNSELKGMTKYSFTFYHPMYVLGSIPFTDIAVTQDERKYLSQNKTFSWIGNLFEFVDKLNANLANTQWHVSVNIPQYEADGETETSMWKKAISISEVLSFDKQMISDALKVAYDTWEIPFVISNAELNEEEYWFKYSDDGETFTPVNQALLDQVPRQGRNLLLGSNVFYQNTDYLIASYDFGQLAPRQGETVTITIHGRLGAGRDYFRVYNSTASCLIKTMNLATEVEHGRTWSGDVVWSTTDSRGQQVANDKVLIYQYPSSASGTSSIEWIKIEFGSTRTTYTLAPEETLIGTTVGNYIGRASKSYYSDIPLNFNNYNWSNYYPFDISFGLGSKPILDQQGNEFIFKMGQGLGLKNNSRTPRNNKIVTRIVGSGSERNIPYGYPQIRWYGNQSWEWTAYTNVVTIFTRSLADFNTWVDGLIEAATNEDKIAALTAYKYAVNNGLTSVNPHDSSGLSPQGATYTYSWSVTIKGSYVASSYEDANIDSTYEVSTNGGYVIDLENSTPSPSAYPIYMGIVSGEYVKLIKHPFTRTTLMPSEYIETVFDKVSPYMNGGYANPDYNPDTEIVDYIDADSNYPNPINPLAPSVEIHQFEDIYPRLNDRSLIAVQPYEEWNGMDEDGYRTYVNKLFLEEYLNSWERTYLTLSLAYVTSSYNQDVVIEDTDESGALERLVMKRHTYAQNDIWWNITIVSPNLAFSVNVYTGADSPSNYVDWDDTMDDNGNYLQSYFKITLPQLDFDLYACASITEQMDINMRSGACMGCTFPIQVDWEDYKANFYKADGTFDPVIHTQEGDGHIRDGNKYPDSSQGQITIIVQKDIDTFGTLMPNVYQQPKGESSQGADDGDKFVILGISLPESYITNAEQELDEAMMSYMLENNIYYYDYPLKIDAYFLATHTDILLQIRNNSVFKFQYANTVVSLNIKQITIKYGEDVLPQYDITLTDDIEVVLNSIGQVSENVAKLNNLISLLKQDYSRNVWSILNEKLSRKDDDVARGSITFEKKTFQKGGTEFGSYTQGVSGASINNNGDAELKNVVARGNTIINGTSHQKGDVVFGTALDKTIAGAGVYSGEGGMVMETDYLHVHKKFFAKEVEIQETTYIGGRVVNSPANGFTVKDVIYQSGYGYVLFFDDKEGDEKTRMTWKAGDQALCQTFNLVDENGYTANRYWWRVVNDCGTWDATGAHHGHLYIRVSDLQGEEDENSSVPQIGDKVVMLGHRQWGSETASEAAQRQGAIIEASAGATGDVVPFIKIYRGISSFNLEQATLVAEMSYDKIDFLANMMRMRIVDGQTTITQQMTSILGTVNGVSILSGKFESDGYGALRPKEAGGLVLTTTSAGLKLYYLDSNDELHEAQIGLAFNEDEDISTAQISADNINLNGVVTANGFFKINLNGSMEATSGSFSGHVKSVPAIIHSHNIDKYVHAEINPYTGTAWYVLDLEMMGRNVIFYESPEDIYNPYWGNVRKYPTGYGVLSSALIAISPIPRQTELTLQLPWVYGLYDISGHGESDWLKDSVEQMGNGVETTGYLNLFRYWYWQKRKGTTKAQNDAALVAAQAIGTTTISVTIEGQTYTKQNCFYYVEPSADTSDYYLWKAWLDSFGITYGGTGQETDEWHDEWENGSQGTDNIIFARKYLYERYKQSLDYMESEITVYYLTRGSTSPLMYIYGKGATPYSPMTVGWGNVTSLKEKQYPHEVNNVQVCIDIYWELTCDMKQEMYNRYTLGLEDWEG